MTASSECFIEACQSDSDEIDSSVLQRSQHSQHCIIELNQVQYSPFIRSDTEDFCRTISFLE